MFSKPFPKNIVSRIKNMSLLKKITLAYAFIILIPVITAACYTYFQAKVSVKNDMLHQTESSIYQITESMNNKALAVHSMCSNLTNNSNLKYFLSANYSDNTTLYNEYSNSISPFVSSILYNLPFDIYDIRIFMGNKGIPEKWGIFYNDGRIKDKEWYNSLISSPGIEVWLMPHNSQLFTTYFKPDTTQVFSLAKAINDFNSKYLGVVVIDIKRDVLLADIKAFNDSNNDTNIYVLDSSDQIIYEPENAEAIPMPVLEGTNGSIWSDNILYVYRTIDSLNIQIVSVTDVNGYMNHHWSPGKTLFYIIAAIGAGILLLEFLTYIVLRSMFKKFRQIVKTMDIVVEGDFSKKIPVDSWDEVGKLTNDFNIMIEKINQLVKDVLKKEVSQKDAQLLALQYQINPHFIYNMIDSFRLKMEISGDYQTASAITDFGKIIRYNVSNQSLYSTIGEEVSYIGKYVNLQRFKLGDRIKLHIKMEEGMERIQIIRFILQPIVENCFKHGFAEKDGALVICVNVAKADDMVIISICDNGSGVEGERLQELNQTLAKDEPSEFVHNFEGGIGLQNIYRRIKLYYGNECSLRLESKMGQFTKATLSIPVGK